MPVRHARFRRVGRMTDTAPASADRPDRTRHRGDPRHRPRDRAGARPHPPRPGGGRSADAVAALVAELPSASPFVGDLGAGDVPDLPASLDVLVHSAGVEQGTRIADTSRDVWEQVFATNVFAVAELTLLALPALRAARGIVVPINSGSGFTAGPGGGVYAASKFALRPSRTRCARRSGERRAGVERAPGPHRLRHAARPDREAREDYDTRVLPAPRRRRRGRPTVVDLPERGTI